MAAGLPILTYHSIDDSGSVISVAPSLFRWQMAWLAEHGFQTLPLSEASRCLASGEPLPTRAVVLTFDDAYQNVYTEVFPVLNEHGFRATIFVITDYCGAYLDWPGPVGAAGRLPTMDWAAIAEMHTYGMEFGAHTLTHPDLTRLPLHDAEREMVASKTVLQDRLGADVEVFAYPFGAYNAPVRAVVQRHFLSAVSTRLGRARPQADLHTLRRFDMYYLQPVGLFKALAGRRLDLYLQLRQGVRDARRLLGGVPAWPLPSAHDEPYAPEVAP